MPRQVICRGKGSDVADTFPGDEGKRISYQMILMSSLREIL